MIALSTGSLHTYGLDRAFEFAALAGFEAVEVVVDQRWDTRQANHLRGLTQRFGVGVASLHAPFIPAVPGWSVDPVDRLQRTIEIAEPLGARHVVVHPPSRMLDFSLAIPALQKTYRFGVPAARDRRFRNFLLRELSALEARTPIRIGVENMGAYRFLGRRVNPYQLNTPEQLQALPHLTMDTTHLGTWGHDILNWYERLKSRIIHFHISNYNGKQHRLLHDGALPLAALLQALKRDRFDGVVVVELQPESLDAGDDEKVIDHLRKTRGFCKQHYA